MHPGQPEEPKHQRPGFNSTEGASSLKDDTSSYTPCIGLRTFQPQPPKWPPSRVICGWVLAACPSSEETTCCVLHATVWSMCSIGMRMSARPGLTRRPAEAVRPMEGGGCVVGVARGQGTCPCMSTRAQGPPHSSSLHRRVAWVAWTAPRCRVKGAELESIPRWARAARNPPSARTSAFSRTLLQVEGRSRSALRLALAQMRHPLKACRVSQCVIHHARVQV